MSAIRIIMYPLILVKRTYNKLVDLFLKIYYKAHGVKIGKDTFISPNAYIDKNKSNMVEIGENCMITMGCKLLCHSDAKMGGLRKIWTGEREYGKVIIGNNVFMGVDTVVLPGVTIGNNVIIGAKSLINKDIPSNSIVFGIPAKVIKKFDIKSMRKEK